MLIIILILVSLYVGYKIGWYLAEGFDVDFNNKEDDV